MCCPTCEFTAFFCFNPHLLRVFFNWFLGKKREIERLVAFCMCPDRTASLQPRNWTHNNQLNTPINWATTQGAFFLFVFKLSKLSNHAQVRWQKVSSYRLEMSKTELKIRQLKIREKGISRNKKNKRVLFISVKILE